jgi:predicted transcriptional regulator YheO
MNKATIRQYSILVEFLGESLGPDYEVVLHDLGDKAKSIVAIAHGYISGRGIGAPLTSKALEMLAERQYERLDFKINYSSLSGANKTLRSSSMFIKDERGRPVGLLCINFDDSRYGELCTKVLKLCHPDEFVEHNLPVASIRMPQEEVAEAERFPDSIAAVTDGVVAEIVARTGIPVERLTQEEKLSVVEALNGRGVFLLKGAVSQVAKVLHSSEASIYRYLSKISKAKD